MSWSGNVKPFPILRLVRCVTFSASWLGHVDCDRDGGRDRDRFVQRSMALVVLDQRLGVLRRGRGDSKTHVDPLKDGGVAAASNGFEIDLDPTQPYVRV